MDQAHTTTVSLPCSLHSLYKSIYETTALKTSMYRLTSLNIYVYGASLKAYSLQSNLWENSHHLIFMLQATSICKQISMNMGKAHSQNFSLSFGWGEGGELAGSEALNNLSIILKTVQQTSCHKYNINIQLFAIAFIHLYI